MMKNLFCRMFTGVIAVMLVLTLMVGCGKTSSKDVEKREKTKQEETKQGTDIKQEEGTQDTYLIYQPKEGKKYDFSWTARMVNPVEDDAPIVKYHNDKYNVNIQIVNIDISKYDELISLKFASGEVPDLIRINSTENLLQYVKQDVLAEVPENVIKKFAPNLYAEYTENVGSDVFSKYGFIDNKFYAIPQLMSRSIYRSAVVYRGDWLKNVGIEKEPATLDEFEKAMYKFAQEDPDRNSKRDTFGLANTGMGVVFGAFGYMPSVEFSDIKQMWQNRDGKLVYSAVQPEMKDALRLLSKWYKDGIIDPEFINGEDIGSKTGMSFIQGRIGFSCNGGWFYWNPPIPGRSESAKVYSELVKANPEAAKSLIYGTPPMGATGKMGVYQANIVLSTYYGFGKQLEKEPDKLGKLLQVIDGICFESYENALNAYFGVKGKDWDYNEDGVGVSLAEKWLAKDAQKKGGHQILLMFTSFHKWKNDNNLPAVKEWLERNNFKTGGMRDELDNKILPSNTKYWPELSKIQAEAYVDIITGSKPIDYFDEFVAKWRSAGGDVLEKEANQK